MTRKKEIILSSIGGIVTLFLGYLIWRHEQAISVANQQALNDQNAAQNQALAQQMMMAPVGVGAASYAEPTIAAPQTESIPANNDIAAILAAFGYGGSTQVQTDGSSSSGSAATLPTMLGPSARLPIRVTASPIINGPVSVSGTQTTAPTITGTPKPTPNPILGPRYTLTVN